MRIWIDTDAHSWHATFEGSSSMPNGTRLPLPFRRIADASTVRADLAVRFPGADIAQCGNAPSIPTMSDLFPF